MTGTKNDNGKARWSLMPWKQLAQVVDVLTYGAQKYSDNNWQKVDKTRYADAAMRHLSDYLAGVRSDPETGMTPLAHSVCCILFMMWHDDQGGSDAQGS